MVLKSKQKTIKTLPQNTEQTKNNNKIAGKDLLVYKEKTEKSNCVLILIRFYILEIEADEQIRPQ